MKTLFLAVVFCTAAFSAHGQTATTPYFVYSKSAHAVNLPVNDAGIVRIVVRVAETNQLVTTANIVVRPGALSLSTAGGRSPSPVST